MNPNDEMNMLRDEANAIKNELDAINKRIGELESSFALRCFQRLSLRIIATQLCR